MAIMNVLSELHQEQNLKLNLKFEIEVLCKTLGIDINVSLFCSYVLYIFNSLSLINRSHILFYILSLHT